MLRSAAEGWPALVLADEYVVNQIYCNNARIAKIRFSMCHLCCSLVDRWARDIADIAEDFTCE